MIKFNKEDLEILLGVIFIITLIVLIGVKIRKPKIKQYEYYVNGYYGKSINCYVDKNEDLKCQVGKYLISVDEYYIAK